jgi:adenylate kinase family enzyme
LHITLIGSVDPKLAASLSKALGLRLISPVNNQDPMTGLYSDDRFIDQILDELDAAKGTSLTSPSFLLFNCPQNIIQAQSLDLALTRAGFPLDAAIAIDSAKTSQNRETRALIRYYRSQNKLVLIDESSTIEERCKIIHTTYDKRRSHN